MILGTRLRTILLLVFILVLSSPIVKSQSRDLKLWFATPAANWNEALPVGNGKLGAMMFGGIEKERLQLNEETVWSGGRHDFVNPLAKESTPKVRALLFAGKYKQAQELAQKTLMGDKRVSSSYQTLVDLEIELHHPSDVYTNYRRELDLDNAVASVAYSSGNVRFTRELFSSAPDNVIVLRMSADKEGAISFKGSLSRAGNKADIIARDGALEMREHISDGNGVKVLSIVKMISQGGNIKLEGSKFSVSAANSVVILISAATDYWGWSPEQKVRQWINEASSKSFDSLKASHISDYQRYFKRVEFKLGGIISDFSTDQRLSLVRNGIIDSHLVELYYQFGRYLLISSSRPGSLPANLQGIWADGLNPPWDADYHININIQMNYWPAEVTNLPEMHLPFLTFIDSLRNDGSRTAREMYGMPGVVAHFTTDAWHFTETYGQTQWAMWPMGYAWAVDHMWQHYQYTLDKEFLRTTGYPAMKDAAIFCLNWLTKDPKTKRLVSGPSISPENRFIAADGDTATMVMGPTMDHMIIRQLFSNTIAAADILQLDKELKAKFKRALNNLAPTRIGSDGRIMEWIEEFKESEPGHRHLSHLYGLHPANEITAANPVLLDAARKTIDFRLSHGGGHTGWSRAWIINFFARLHDGEECLNNLNALLSKSTLNNLFDNHPPFQIDGNFGATAGITEMLMQSHTGEIVLLPALPKAWTEGSIKGIRARNGFELSVEWSDGKLQQVSLTSSANVPVTLRYDNKIVSINTKAGDTIVLDNNLQIIK